MRARGRTKCAFHDFDDVQGYVHIPHLPLDVLLRQDLLELGPSVAGVLQCDSRFAKLTFLTSLAASRLLPALVILVHTPDVCCPDSVDDIARPLSRRWIREQASIFIEADYDCSLVPSRISQVYTLDSPLLKNVGRVAAESSCLADGVKFRHVRVTRYLGSFESDEILVVVVETYEQ
jgi:hypothetical protein